MLEALGPADVADTIHRALTIAHSRSYVSSRDGSRRQPSCWRRSRTGSRAACHWRRSTSGAVSRTLP